MCIRSITGPMIEKLGSLAGHDSEFYPESTMTIGEILAHCPRQIPIYAKFVSNLTNDGYGSVTGETTIAELMEMGEHYMADLCEVQWIPFASTYVQQHIAA